MFGILVQILVIDASGARVILQLLKSDAERVETVAAQRRIGVSVGQALVGGYRLLLLVQGVIRFALIVQRRIRVIALGKLLQQQAIRLDGLDEHFRIALLAQGVLRAGEVQVGVLQVFEIGKTFVFNCNPLKLRRILKPSF